MGKSKKSKKHKKYSSSEEEWVEKQIFTKSKKAKIKSSKKKRHYSSSNTDSYSSDEKYKQKSKYTSDSDESKSSKETAKFHNTKTENEQESNPQREEWMNIQTKFYTTSNSDRKREREEQKRIEREKQQYDPRTCDRELNPYWKQGGDGLPKFKKPCDSDDEDKDYSKNYKSNLPNSGESKWRKKYDTDNSQSRPSSSSSNWRKKEFVDPKVSNTANNLGKQEKPVEDTQYTEKDLNALAAKLVKAEIMGNTKQIADLKEKLEKARNSLKETLVDEEVILTQTDHRGMSKPLQLRAEYGESSKSKKKKRTETHKDNQRIRYFADDDKYSLKEMFENEKYNAGGNQDQEFLKAYSKIKHNDDLDDIFSDNIREKHSDSKLEEKNRTKAINDHQKISKSLDNCDKCLQSEFMLKHLMVSMGDNVYLALPPFEPLTDGHCLIIPIRHTPCATQLDENEWSDILNVRKSLVKLFQQTNEDLIFFECAMNLHRFPHMVIECIPLPKEEGDMAPIYFKKAIDESEIEWAQNKKLISLKGRDVRKAVPKGLPYFSVSFGMEEGFAHVIEDEKLFPTNFAQEIIGGMLDLHHSKWRKPKRQSFDDQSKRVTTFSKKWKDYDCLVSY
ncbi:CWF19-like protein 2 homolog [Diorhabda sublineata]|uniref:CWF19-like protein 2 homolog n=1 Tax=Diorhabda sublineata TaxID=1163346 RepID=UPI0024E144AD|nr:CWF19-like protein 2 homolog [Diorhabda sublineata]